MSDSSTTPRPLFTDGWSFPLPRPHTGVALSNGVMGLLVWGEHALELTVGRTGFWDHRGGNPFSSRVNYSTLKTMLQSGGEEELRAIFQKRDPSGQRPHQLPCGRLTVSTGVNPTHATLEADTCTLCVWFSGIATPVRIRIENEREQATIGFPPELSDQLQIKFISAYEACGKPMQSTGVSPPTTTDHPGPQGRLIGQVVTQALPADESLSFEWRLENNALLLRTWLGESSQSSNVEVISAVEDAPKPDSFWPDFWQSVPRVTLPNTHLSRLYDYGLLKFGGLTHPSGIAATLQGTWMEEYQLPPWSNDYHFNINLQMCYWPALSCNRTSHMEPLWRMIRGWFPQLLEVGQRFFGAPGSMMLPHAVDDRCQAIGSYWQGTIDHASTAWMAQLAWLDYRYSQNMKQLRETAWPLLNGAFNGFWAMLEQTGDALRLPISVSPEYGEGAIGTWGVNASFQIAALHCIAGILPRAAAVLGQPVDPRWNEVTRRLPAYALAQVAPGPWDTPNPTRKRISLWEGQDLEHSHRHHSHLAAIFPFATIDHHNPRHTAIIDETMEHWTRLGSGQWSAWGLPWSAILCARTNRVDAAVVWLNWFVDNCANEGDSLSVSGIKGSMSNWCGWDDARRKPGENFEIMQLDAHMGFITAINELIVHSVSDEIRVLPTVPYRWKDFSFERIGAERGFQISGVVENRRLAKLSVYSPFGGPLNLRHSLIGDWLL
ncbi:MAG TPA: hypothetical protein VGB55_12115, partial [Tepidisphaeraceae bacterium]